MQASIKPSCKIQDSVADEFLPVHPDACDFCKWNIRFLDRCIVGQWVLHWIFDTEYALGDGIHTKAGVGNGVATFLAKQ